MQQSLVESKKKFLKKRETKKKSKLAANLSSGKRKIELDSDEYNPIGMAKKKAMKKRRSVRLKKSQQSDASSARGNTGPAAENGQKAQASANEAVTVPPEKFSDEKLEKHFRNFLRILKFKHRKNIMIIHEIDKQIENQFQKNQMDQFSQSNCNYQEDNNIEMVVAQIKQILSEFQLDLQPEDIDLDIIKYMQS